jgi:hypothetical protein
MIRRYYPVIVGNHVCGAQSEMASAVGPLCTALDLLAAWAEFPRAEVGDLIVVLQSSAYGLKASPLAFLSQPRAIPLQWRRPPIAQQAAPKVVLQGLPRHLPVPPLPSQSALP